MKTDSEILFFHGYGSSRNTDKFTSIVFKNKHAENYDYDLGLKKVIEQAEKFVESYLDKTEEIILIGHSMGAFVANYLSKKYNLKALLINPCFIPEVTKPEILDNFNFELSNEKIIVMIEEDDEVLDYKLLLDKLKNNKGNYEVHIYKGGHHRLARSSEINEFIADLSDKKYPYTF